MSFYIPLDRAVLGAVLCSVLSTDLFVFVTASANRYVIVNVMNADRHRFNRLRQTGWQQLPEELQRMVLESVTGDLTVGSLRLVDKAMLQAISPKFEAILRLEDARVKQMQLARVKNSTKVTSL